MAALLSVRDLRVRIDASHASVPVVNGVDLDVAPGEIVAIVGESGSGKTMTASAVLGLLPPGARRQAERLAFAGRDLLTAGNAAHRSLLRHDIAYMVQNSLTALNPSATVGRQLAGMIAFRNGVGARAARNAAQDWLGRVGIADPARVFAAYPHTLSGGMKQRVIIAMAINSRPKLVIADEPTSALDAATQRQVLDILRGIRADHGTAILLITHDFGVVSALADRVAVMTEGRIVEDGPVHRVLRQPSHPYSRSLLAAVPRLRGVADAA